MKIKNHLFLQIGPLQFFEGSVLVVMSFHNYISKTKQKTEELTFM